MSDLDKTACFTLLDKTNYSEWVVRMEAVLIHHGLWDSVVFDDAGLVGDDLQSVRETWTKKRSAKKMAEARAEIILRVEDSQLAHMRDRDPTVIWEALARIHIA